MDKFRGWYSDKLKRKMAENAPPEILEYVEAKKKEREREERIRKMEEEIAKKEKWLEEFYKE